MHIVRRCLDGLLPEPIDDVRVRESEQRGQMAATLRLCHVLQQLDYNARPLRVEAAVFPDDRKVYGTLLGRPSRQAAEPGMWR